MEETNNNQATSQSSSPQSSSRRDFLKASTAAAVAGGVAAPLVVPRGVHAAAGETIKVGLIGCGGRGTGAVTDSLRADPGTRLVAMGDAFQDHLDRRLGALKGRFADRVDVPKERQFVGFDAFEKVLDCDIDVVILATPPGFRPQHFEAAIKAGKHVFMEKPVAVDAPGVRQVLAANEKAKERGLCVGVGLQRHHQNVYQATLQQLKEEKIIGDIVTLRAYWNGSGVWDPRRTRDQVASDMEYQLRNWYYYNWLCGDHIVEQHIHNIDVCNWIKDAFPVKAQGMGGRQVRTAEKYGEIFDHHSVEFTYADGSKLFSFCRHQPNTWRSVSEHAIGTKGFVSVGSGRIFDAEGKGLWRYRGKNNSPYVQEHIELIAAIRNGLGGKYNEGEYGAKSTMTAIFGRMATYSGAELKWDEALASNIKLAPETLAWDAEVPEPRVPMPGITRVV